VENRKERVYKISVLLNTWWCFYRPFNHKQFVSCSNFVLKMYFSVFLRYSVGQEVIRHFSQLWPFADAASDMVPSELLCVLCEVLRSFSLHVAVRSTVPNGTGPDLQSTRRQWTGNACELHYLIINKHASLLSCCWQCHGWTNFQCQILILTVGRPFLQCFSTWSPQVVLRCRELSRFYFLWCFAVS
jgi:hypothetical protein